MKYIISLFIVAVFLTGCKTKQHSNDNSEKLKQLPKEWLSGKNAAPVNHSWVKDFDDESLLSLVNEAQENNFDLQAAAARLEEAYALAGIAGADRLPTLNLETGVEKSRRGAAPNLQDMTEYDLFLRFGWELDIWGKLKDRKNAAEADFASEYYAYQASQLSLAASTVRFWVNSIEAKLQLQLAEESEKSFLNTYNVINERFKKGISEALDVRLAHVDLANGRQNTQQRKADYDASVRALEVLLGRYPAGELKVTDKLAGIKAGIPLGLPAEMLNRRPDILAALKAVEASGFRVSENKKELLPGINLTASVGNTAHQFDKIFNAQNLLWSVAGSLTQPLFQGGRIRASIRQAKAREKQEIALLMQVVFDACQEVETAVNAEKFLDEKEKQIAIAVEESSEAFQLASDRYSKGLTDIITLLSTQRSEFTYRSRLLEVKLQRLLNRLNLYLALGGDFLNSTSNTEEEN